MAACYFNLIWYNLIEISVTNQKGVFPMCMLRIMEVLKMLHPAVEKSKSCSSGRARGFFLWRKDDLGWVFF